MPSHRIETEAKFVVPDASTFNTLKKINRLGHFELESIGIQTVADRYIDTADKRLYQAGFACRLRTIKEKLILTLKSLTPTESHIHRRQEIEVEVETTDQPQAWAESDAKRLVMEIAGTAPLQTLFNLYQTRHKFHTRWQGGQPVIEFSLDEVSLHDITTIDYFELEAELMEAGTEADLARFTELLQRDWPLKVETQSKFERGFASIEEKKNGGR